MITLTNAAPLLNSSATKTEIQEYAKAYITTICKQSGTDCLQTYIQLKRYEIYIDALLKGLRPAALSQSTSFKRPTFKYAGATVAVHQRTQYDYSSDLFWKETQQTKQQIQRLQKEREIFLKSIKGTHREVLNETTGELQTIFAPKTTSQRTIIVRI